MGDGHIDGCWMGIVQSMEEWSVEGGKGRRANKGGGDDGWRGLREGCERGVDGGWA